LGSNDRSSGSPGPFQHLAAFNPARGNSRKSKNEKFLQRPRERRCANQKLIVVLMVDRGYNCGFVRLFKYVGRVAHGED
jgi:hypothetical protein